MSVQTLDARHRSPHGDKPAPTSALAHIPGDNGWPLVGHTLVVLSDPKGFVERLHRHYGRPHSGPRPGIARLGRARGALRIASEYRMKPDAGQALTRDARPKMRGVGDCRSAQNL